MYFLSKYFRVWFSHYSSLFDHGEDNDPFFYDIRGSSSQPIGRYSLAFSEGVYQFNGIPEASTGLISDGQEVGQLYANDFDCTETDPTACGLIFSIGIGLDVFVEKYLERLPSSLAPHSNSLALSTK